jgi:4-hydroxybenzoate polyprenyltransferase
MFRRTRQLLEMIRFSHTLFALPFALLSAALAWRKKGEFSWLDLVGILLCMVFARSAAMAFNRLADRHLDARNPRTAGRHLPSGQLSVGAVWVFTLVSAAGFLLSTLLFLWAEPPNAWPVLLAGPVLLLLCVYSYTKRFTSLAHFWLGAALLLAPLSAWIAIRGIADLGDLVAPLTLGLAVQFWVAGFDIIYACQDAEHDRQAGLASIPARVGVRAALRLSAGCHCVMLVLLVGLYWAAAPYLGWVYLVGVGGIALLLVYEHALVRPEDLSRVNRAFFQVNAVVSVGLLVLVLVELFLSGPRSLAAGP